MEMGFWGHESAGKVQVAGSWPFGLDTNVFFYDIVLIGCRDIISATSFFFLFCSLFYLVLVEGLLRHLWKFEIACLSYILALCIEEWHMVFVVEFLLMKLVFNIFFVSAITFSIFWSCIFVPLGFRFTYSSHYFSPPYFCMCCCLWLEFLFFTSFSCCLLVPQNSIHVTYSQKSLWLSILFP